MKNLLLFLPILLFLSSCRTTTSTIGPNYKFNPFKNKYLNQLEEGAELINSGYHFSLERTPSGTFIFKQYYPPTKQLTHYYTYESLTTKTPHGPYKNFTDSGILYNEGGYKNGLKSGEWKHYHYKTGFLIKHGSYSEDKKTGEWKYYCYKYNHQYHTFNFVDGEKHGPYSLVNFENQIIEEGTYEEGKLTSRTNHLPNPNGCNARELDVMPHLKSCENFKGDSIKMCSDYRLLKYINSRIRYPYDAQKYRITGLAMFAFTVSENGEIVAIETINGLNDDIKKHCIKIIKKMPQWNPGIFKGAPVNVYFELPVRFQFRNDQ